MKKVSFRVQKDASISKSGIKYPLQENLFSSVDHKNNPVVAQTAPVVVNVKKFIPYNKPIFKKMAVKSNTITL